MKVKEGLWMGRTEVTVKQFRKFADETGYVTDAERPGGKSQFFNPKWRPLTGKDEVSWLSMEGKSWRDPNHGIPEQDDFPVVCVSYNDMKAFCEWLTKKAQEGRHASRGRAWRGPLVGIRLYLQNTGHAAINYDTIL